jgi:hypothetical protein
MKSRRALLNELLQTLVDEWGHEEVATALAATAPSLGHSASRRGSGSSLRPSGEKARVSATDLIRRTTPEGEQKETLLQLAERYDRKQFLPSVADVREFLIMMGERPAGMKDRHEAFRVLLKSLTRLPVERLRQFARTALHSGPAELGPLSDAIAAASERLPRPRQTNTD